MAAAPPSNEHLTRSFVVASPQSPNTGDSRCNIIHELTEKDNGGWGDKLAPPVPLIGSRLSGTQGRGTGEDDHVTGSPASQHGYKVS